MIRTIYQQELGRAGDAVDEEGIAYWANIAEERGLDDDQLARAIRWSAGAENQALRDTPSTFKQYSALGQDNQWLAWQRAYNFDKDTADRQFSDIQEAANLRIELQKGQYDYAKTKATKQVNQDFESRGMYRSGGRQAARNTANTDITRQEGLYNAAQTEAIKAANQNRVQSQAALDNENAEQVLATQDRLTMGSIQNG